jgi:hypothetical protein
VPEERKSSFWDRFFGRNQPSAREERVAEYIIHRLGEGAHLGDVVEEEYVRRNATPLEIEEICADPRLVEAAHEHLKRDFDSGELDPGRRPG